MASNKKRLNKAVVNVAGILKKRPNMVGQVSTGTLEQVAQNLNSNSGASNIIAKNELSRRAVNDAYNDAGASPMKKRKGGPANRVTKSAGGSTYRG